MFINICMPKKIAPINTNTRMKMWYPHADIFNKIAETNLGYLISAIEYIEGKNN